MEVHSDWTTTYAWFPGKMPMDRGRWTVTLVDPRAPALTSHLTVE